MKDPSENELLSAYLDGELLADERAEVEEALDRDPAAREFVAELRALCATLRSLPAHKLDDDFAQRVASLAKGCAESESGELRVEKDRPRGRDASRRPLGKRFLRPRALMWPGVAVAVALALWAMDNQRSSEDGTTGGQMAERGEDAASGNDPGSTMMASGDDPAEVGPKVHIPMDSPKSLAVRCKVGNVTAAGAVFQGLLESRSIESNEIVEKPDGSTYVVAVLTADQLRAVLADLQQQSDQFPTVLSPGFDPATASDDESLFRVRFIFDPVAEPTPSP